MRFIVWLSMAVWVLSGCNGIGEPPPLACGDIHALIPARLLDVPHNDFSSAVKQTYDLQDEHIIAGDYKDPRITWTSQIRWQWTSAIYRAEFIEEQLAVIRAELWEDTITAESVVECFGAPEVYMAYQAVSGEGANLVLELWYPERGLGFRGTERVDWSTEATISPRMRMQYIYVTHPGAIDEIATKISPVVENSDNRLQLLRPWTGSLQNLEVIRLDSTILPP